MRRAKRLLGRCELFLLRLTLLAERFRGFLALCHDGGHLRSALLLPFGMCIHHRTQRQLAAKRREELLALIRSGGAPARAAAE